MNIEAKFFLCVMLKYVTAEFVMSRRNPTTPCETQGTALVEQFFNIVFSEFHHSPPTCICVQMCADQPMYCYPNGCFRGTERKTKDKDTSTVSRLQHEGAKMFLVDNKDFSADMLGNMNSVVSASDAIERPLNYNLINRSNPFKEIVFKFKRIPKLQIKYNLREQIKHSRDKKAEVDVSKTRWPTNKQVKYPYKVNHQRSSRHFASAQPETNQPETPKYFKRYLTKRENQNGLDIGALYLYKDSSNFSLETLIDDLIEKGLEGINSTLGLKINNSIELSDQNNKGDLKLMNSVSESPDITPYLYYDTPNNSIHENFKDLVIENTNQNPKHNDTVVNSTSMYFEIISTLSKEIEKQNNASIEVVENFTGKKYKEFHEENISKIGNFQEPDNTTKNVAISDLKRDIKMPNRKESSCDKVSKNVRKELMSSINGKGKKSKQRLVRKLRNGKLN